MCDEHLYSRDPESPSTNLEAGTWNLENSRNTVLDQKSEKILGIVP